MWFLYLQACGPGWVYVLFNIKDCLYATIPNSVWIRRENKMSACLLDHIQAGGRQLKGDSKPLPWFHPDKKYFFFFFFCRKATVHDIQWTGEWENTDWTNVTQRQHTSFVVRASSSFFFFNEAASMPFSAALFSCSPVKLHSKKLNNIFWRRFQKHR